MTKRKAISKKSRFEVFKRDGFKCQYCGSGAPEVVLHVDHIRPVADGGDNSIINLITACVDCNAGKSDRKLSDGAAVTKQVEQMRALNEKREQLKMMATWREQLSDLDTDALEVCANAWSDACAGKYSLNEKGRAELRKLVKKFGVSSTLEAIDIATDKYLSACAEDTFTKESVEYAWKKISGICAMRALPEKQQKARYMRGILINRFRMPYKEYDIALSWLTSAIDAGASIDSLQNLCKSADSYDTVLEKIEDFIVGVEAARESANG